MPPCSEPKCVGLVFARGLCAAHAAGYKRHDSAAELRCANCRGLIRKDEWFQNRDGGVWHVKPCKMHPEIVKERAAAAVKDATA